MVKAIKKKKAVGSDQVSVSLEEGVASVNPEVVRREGQAEGEGGIFDDPAIAQTMAEDPLFKFLKKHANTISTTILLAVLAWVGTRAYQSSYQAALQNSAQEFSALRSEVDALDSAKQMVALKEAALAELAAKEDAADSVQEKEVLESELADAREALEQSTALVQTKLEALQAEKEPYSSLVEPYSALVKAKSGVDAKTLLAANGAVKWQQAAAGSADRMFAELSALATARALVSDSESRTEGVQSLKDLASQGQYVHAAAAAAYADVYLAGEAEAVSADSALEIIETVLAAHPEQAEVLEAKRDQIGVE